MLLRALLFIVLIYVKKSISQRSMECPPKFSNTTAMTLLSHILIIKHLYLSMACPICDSGWCFDFCQTFENILVSNSDSDLISLID